MNGLLRCARGVVLLSAVGFGCGPEGFEGSGSDSEELESSIGTLSQAITSGYVPPAEGSAFGIPGTPPVSTLTVPLAAQPVGRLSGAGRVTKEGSYSYSLPIEILPGRGGMEPSVSLQYESKGGSGLLGVGWSLSTGSSSILRCGKHNASGFRRTSSESRVGQTEGVQFNTADQLCLDGQKLEVVSGTSGVGAAEYRTEVETFAKVVGVAQVGCSTCEPAAFKVYHKNGLIGTYLKHGGTNASGSVNAGFYRQAGAGETVTLAWMQTRLEDRSGNAIEYVWTKPNATAATHPQSLPMLTDIRYTACRVQDSNTCPYGTGAARRLKLNYSQRDDTQISYTNAVRLEVTQRLTSIDVFGDAASSTPTWKYALAYKQSAFTGRSLLERVQRCAGSVCQPPTSFTWQDSGKTTWNVSSMSTGLSTPWVAAGQANATGTEVNASEVAFSLLDADGDGNLDIIYKSWPASAINSPSGQLVGTSNQAQMGVGPVDYIAMGSGGYFGTPLAIDLEGDGIPQASTRCVTSPPASALQGEIADLSAAAVVDLDADGRDELFAPLNLGCPFRWVEVTNDGLKIGVRVTPSLRPSMTENATLDHRVFKILRLSRSTGLLEKKVAPIPFVGWGHWERIKYSFADLTGGGFPDLIYGAAEVADDAVFVKRGSHVFGAGTATSEDSQPEATYTNPAGAPVGGYDTKLRFSWQPNAPTARTPNLIRVLDENGDGRSEIKQLSYDKSERGFSFSALGAQAIRTYFDGASTSWTQPQNIDGTGGTPPNQWPAYPTSSNFASAYMSWRYADVNGDGLKDALYAQRNLTTSKYEWFFRLNTGLPAYANPVAVGHVDTLNNYGSLSQVTVINGVVRMPQDSGLRTVDMNGDGRDDLVLLDTPAATGSVMYSTGSGFSAPFSLPARGSGTIQRIKNANNAVVWPALQLADIDGDGLTDVVEWVKDPADTTKRRLVVLSHKQLPHKSYDVITDVRDALSSLPAESVTYGKLSDPAVHLSDSIPRYNSSVRTSAVCRYPARCTSRGTVVTGHKNFRTPQNVDLAFNYAGSRFDVTGRGSLGFREVHIRDLVTGFVTTETYDQGAVNVLFNAYFYPNLSEPAKSVTNNQNAADSSLAGIDANGARVTTTRTPTYATFAGTAAMPLRMTRVVKETVTADYDRLSSTAVDRNRRTADMAFDVDGNVSSQSDTVVDLGTIGDANAAVTNLTSARVTSHLYDPADYSNWILGLRSQTIEDSSIDEPLCVTGTVCQQIAQRVTFEYESAARKLLRKVNRERMSGPTARLSTVLERDNAGLVRRTRLQDESGEERVSDVDYEPNGIYPKARRNAMGHVSWLSYNVPLGVLDRATDPNGVFVSNTHDTLGWLRRVDRADFTWTTYSYTKVDEGSDNLQAFSVAHRGGAGSKTFFDTRGRSTLTITPGFNPDITAPPAVVTSVATQYDAMGNAVLSSFNQQNVAWLSLEATPLATLRTGHASGAQITNAGRYDVLGRPSSETVGDPNKTGSTEGAGEVTVLSYPRLGEVISTDPMGHRQRRLSDARGNVRRIYQSRQGDAASIADINHGYDALGNLIYVKTKDASAERFTHDHFGRLDSWTMGGSAQARTYTYNAFDELIRTTESSELGINLTYDALGRLVSRVESSNPNAAERTITYEWDTSIPVGGGAATLGQLAKAIVVGGHETEYTYDATARPRTITHKFKDGPTLEVSTAYSASGRLNRIIYPSVVYSGTSVPGIDVRYQFASNGQVAQVVQSGSSSLWTVAARHPLGMVTEAKTGVTDVALNKGFTSFSVYEDNTLRPEEESLVNPQGFLQKRLGFSYHPNGSLAARDFNSSITETYDYNTTGHRLTDYARTGAPSWPNVGVEADYRYSPSGDITKIITAVDSSPDWKTASTTLPSETPFAYGANSTAAGGVNAGYTDLLLSVGAQASTYGYDFAGRQVQENANGAVARKIQNYNTFNLPTLVSQYSGGANPSAVTSLAYDAHGSRVSKKKLTTSPALLDESVLYVGKLFEAQNFKDQNLQPGMAGYDLRRSVFRVYADDALVAEVLHDWVNGAKKAHYFLRDHQGSIVYRTEGAVDGTFGAGEMRAYFPFGKRWIVTHPATAAGKGATFRAPGRDGTENRRRNVG